MFTTPLFRKGSLSELLASYLAKPSDHHTILVAEYNRKHPFATLCALNDLETGVLCEAIEVANRYFSGQKAA